MSSIDSLTILYNKHFIILIEQNKFLCNIIYFLNLYFVFLENSKDTKISFTTTWINIKILIKNQIILSSHSQS